MVTNFHQDTKLAATLMLRASEGHLVYDAKTQCSFTPQELTSFLNVLQRHGVSTRQRDLPAMVKMRLPRDVIGTHVKLWEAYFTLF